jgi:hypothetical protein
MPGFCSELPGGLFFPFSEGSQQLEVREGYRWISVNDLCRIFPSSAPTGNSARTLYRNKIPVSDRAELHAS